MATRQLTIWSPGGDVDGNWHYTFGIEENSAWLGHNGMIPGYMTYVVYDPALDASIVLVQNSDKNAGKEPGINPAASRYQQDPLPTKSGERARRRLKSAEMTS